MVEEAGGGAVCALGEGWVLQEATLWEPSLCLSLCSRLPCFQEELFILVLVVTIPTDPLKVTLKETFKVFKDELSLCSQGSCGRQTRTCL